MNFETLLGFGGIVSILFTLLFLIFVIAGAIMPIVILFINYRVSRIEEVLRSSNYTLQLIEHMMRFGNDQTGE